METKLLNKLMELGTGVVAIENEIINSRKEIEEFCKVHLLGRCFHPLESKDYTPYQKNKYFCITEIDKALCSRSYTMKVKVINVSFSRAIEHEDFGNIIEEYCTSFEEIVDEVLNSKEITREEFITTLKRAEAELISLIPD